MSYVGGGSGLFSSAASDRSLAKLAATGTRWIALIVSVYQETIDATTIDETSPSSPTDQDVVHVVAAARRLGLRVMLKPHIDLRRDDRWRGEIGTGFRAEDQWQAWFASYRAMILHQADLSARLGIEQLCIGTELAGTTSRERDWREIVRAVRQRFSGRITYASNHEGEEQSIRWWDAVDLIGVDAYYPLANAPNPTVEALKRAWQDRGYVTILRSLATTYRKPVLLTEIGYRSVAGATAAPWDSTRAGATSQEEQANAYEAAIATFAPQPWVDGLFWWSWSVNPDQGGPGDVDYTPAGKLAEGVLTRFYRGSQKTEVRSPHLLTSCVLCYTWRHSNREVERTKGE
jgi:hypothetical protein